MRAGWKKDPIERAYFEIKRAVQRHNCRVGVERAQQIEALDEAAAQLLNQAAAEATKQKVTRH